MERVRGFLRDIKENQVDTPVWATAFDRTQMVLRDAFGGWRLPFAFAFLLGLWFLGPTGWFALSEATVYFDHPVRTRRTGWSTTSKRHRCSRSPRRWAPPAR